jgi:hypothetical protein
MERVRAIRDAMIGAIESKIWVVTYPNQYALTSNGSRRTAAFHTDAVVPDNEQPSWLLLAWNPKSE